MITIILLPYVSFGTHSPSAIRPDYSLVPNLVFNLILPAVIAIALAVLAIFAIRKKAVLQSSEKLFLIGSIVNSIITYSVLYVAAFSFFASAKTSLYDLPDFVAFPLSLILSAVLLFFDWRTYAKIRRENGHVLIDSGRGAAPWIFMSLSILAFAACLVIFFEPFRFGAEKGARIDYSIPGNLIGNIVVPSVAALVFAIASIITSQRKSYLESSKRSRLISAIVTTLFALTLCLSLFPYLLARSANANLYAILIVVPVACFLEVFFAWRGFLKTDATHETQARLDEN